MSVDTIFFDLDSTLYPEENGLWSAIRSRIDLYLLEVMGFSAQEIPSIRQRFLAHHGTTLKGLQIHYQIDTADYLRFVHDLPLHDYLACDPGLREILLSIPSRRWIFTNSDADHAQRVMAILGITDCFQGLIDIWKLAPYCKPEEAAYQRALALAGDILPEQCALVDDSPDNLAAAKKMGFFTVLVGKNGSCSEADRCLETIHGLPQMVPEFWHR
jgi:pyrimidine 5'-nucleotidase